MPGQADGLDSLIVLAGIQVLVGLYYVSRLKYKVSDQRRDVRNTPTETVPADRS